MMELTISNYTWGEKPDVQLPSTQLLTLLGEQGIRDLVSEHYDLLIQSEIKDLFPKNPVALEKAKEHSAVSAPPTPSYPVSFLSIN